MQKARKLQKLSESQIKAGRAVLGRTQNELSDKSGVSVPTIARLESEGLEKAKAETIDAIVAALSKGGAIDGLRAAADVIWDRQR